MISTLDLYTAPRFPEPPKAAPKPRVKRAPDCEKCPGCRDASLSHCLRCGKNLVTGAAPRISEKEEKLDG